MSGGTEFKIVVVGAGGVGKSGLTLQFCAGKCPKRYDPTIEDSYRKTTEVDRRACTLDILDTAGQEEYASLRGEYMSEGKGFVLVYSITAEDTFAEMETFFKQIGDNKNGGDPVPIVLVGNKLDLENERKVTEQQGRALAEKWKKERNPALVSDVIFFETSAMTNINVNEMFKGLVKVMMKDMPVPAAGGGGGGDATASSSGGQPQPGGGAGEGTKESGDKGGGCKCSIQ